MKKINIPIIVFIFSIFGANAIAQDNILILDRSNVECIYSHTVFDPQLKETQTYNMLLQVGDKYSKYAQYANFRIDSVIMKTNEQISFNAYRRLAKLYGNSGFVPWLMKNRLTQELTVYDKVFIDTYYYNEPYPHIKWTLHKETAIVCGYECTKASADFRGRKWVAWYCNIPVSEGPWKFGGLPGLILKVEDTMGEHKFEAISVRKGRNDISQEKIDYMKSSRIQLNKAVADYKNEPWKSVQGLARKPDGAPEDIPRRRLFHNPIEKE